LRGDVKFEIPVLHLAVASEAFVIMKRLDAKRTIGELLMAQRRGVFERRVDEWREHGLKISANEPYSH
jgi:limonene-1,2-epoxide hydrolase